MGFNLTSFRDSRAGYDGPMSGALTFLQISIADPGTSGTRTGKLVLPKGAKFYVSHAYAYADGITDNGAYPSLKVGTNLVDDSIVAAVNLATGTGALTLLTNLVGSSSTYTVLTATLVNNATSVASGAKVCLVGWVASPPTSYEPR